MKKFLSRIQITDKALIILMVLLLGQNIFALFSKTSPNDIANSIDVVFRTCIASIFGYFLSSNFIKNQNLDFKFNSSKMDFIKNSEETIITPNIIGIKPIMTDDSPLNAPSELKKTILKNSLSNTEENIETNNNLEANADINQNMSSYNYYRNENLAGSNIQILITSIIGISLLIVLFVIRYLPDTNNISIASLSQIRDLVVGCIGFLIGTPNTNYNNDFTNSN